MQKLLALSVAIVMFLPMLARAADTEPTWVGLTGLFTQPTAEIGHPGTVMLEYSEIRFREQNTNKLEDIWFTGGGTFSPVSRLELALLWRNEEVNYGPTVMPYYTNTITKATYIGDVKYQLVRPDRRKLGIAFGIVDLANNTRYIDGNDTGRGRRFFLVGSFDWAHLAITEDHQGIGAVAGARWTLTKSVELLGEFSSKPVFVLVPPRPNDHMNFNLGFRVYPPQVPRLHFDVTAVGDGEFDFGFALGYNL